MSIQANPVRPRWHGKGFLRPAEEEDDNIRNALQQRRKVLGKRLGPTWFSRYVHRLISTPNTRETDGLTTLRGEIEYRPFKWLLTSSLVPSDYHKRPESEISQAPWRILMRSFFVDLPSQVQESVEPIPWKRYPVGPLMPVSWVRARHQKLPREPTWGYRAVFSQEVRDKRRSLTGSWLVVIYITAKDRKWLSKVDERTLITEENLYTLEAFVQSPVQSPKKQENWDSFWSWKNHEAVTTCNDSDRIYALLNENATRVLFGAPFERSWLKGDVVDGAGDVQTAVKVV